MSECEIEKMPFHLPECLGACVKADHFRLGLQETVHQGGIEEPPSRQGSYGGDHSGNRSNDGIAAAPRVVTTFGFHAVA
jgi:hypothetical protein